MSWPDQQEHFDEIMMSTLYLTNMLSWIFIVLAHWNNSLQVNRNVTPLTLYWLQGNQSFFVLTS